MACQGKTLDGIGRDFTDLPHGKYSTDSWWPAVPVVQVGFLAARLGCQLCGGGFMGPAVAGRAEPCIRGSTRRVKALEESIVQRRAQETRVEAARKERAANELATRAELAQAKAELRERLEAHPLAATSNDLLAHVSILLLSKNLARTASSFGAEGVFGPVPNIRAALGEGWLCSKLRHRIWWTRTDCDDLVVVGPGFIASDTHKTGVGSALGRVAAALNLDDLIGHAAEGADHVKEELEAVLADHGTSCSWPRQPKPKPNMRLST